MIGAGPVGLRAAIELRLLGAWVTVVERRTAFSRLNQLHLWKWCYDDLTGLGARILEPPPQDFGSNPDLVHASISDLQALLLKTALLLGVEVFLGTTFTGVKSSSGAWRATLVATDSGASQSACPSPIAPSSLCPVVHLVGSDGFGGTVGNSVAGIETVEMGILRSENAIGLVCNFAPMPEQSGERNLRSFSLASQFFLPRFQELTTVTGAELENIVYTKSKHTHYFVMTPTRRCLVNAGVIRDGSCKPLLARENIDRPALDAFVRRVVAFPFKAGEPTITDVAAGGGRATLTSAASCQDVAGPTASSQGLVYADAGPQLFDFSKLKRASTGVAFVEDKDKSDAVDQALMVSLVGDALLEPFWPEGLGIVRGFLSALDMASVVAMWAGGAEREEVTERCSKLFAQLKTLGASTRGAVLCPDEKTYRLAPETRYRGIGSFVPRQSVDGIVSHGQTFRHRQTA